MISRSSTKSSGGVQLVVIIVSTGSPTTPTKALGSLCTPQATPTPAQNRTSFTNRKELPTATSESISRSIFRPAALWNCKHCQNVLPQACRWPICATFVPPNAAGPTSCCLCSMPIRTWTAVKRPCSHHIIFTLYLFGKCVSS